MKNKTLIIIFIFLTVIALGFYFLRCVEYSHIQTVPNTTSMDKDATTSPSEINTVKWKTYENTKYGYKFEYPGNGNVQKEAEMESGDISTSSLITVGVRGVGTKFRLEVWEEYENLPENVIAERKDLIGLPLKSFAQKLYFFQQSNNDRFEGRILTDLQENYFKGEKSFEFNLDNLFSTDVFGSGFAFPSQEVQKCVIISHNDSKMTIIYPLDDGVSERIVGSFQFYEK